MAMLESEYVELPPAPKKPLMDLQDKLNYLAAFGEVTITFENDNTVVSCDAAITKNDPINERVYIVKGASIEQCVKELMINVDDFISEIDA